MRPRPDEVTLSDQARAFVPPATMPLYRLAPTPITEAGVRKPADELGLATGRAYFLHRSSGVSASGEDGQWLLTFYRDDLGCFRLTALEGDRQATAAFERTENVRAVSQEEAIAAADQYLAAFDYRVGLAPRVFARTSIGRSAGGDPRAPQAKIIGFAYTAQHAVPDEVEVTILPVEKAAEDLLAGEGGTPTRGPGGERLAHPHRRSRACLPCPARGFRGDTLPACICLFRIRADEGVEDS